MNISMVICGIDTNCGKSVASILIYEYLKLYFSVNPIIVKPVQTGQELDTIFINSVIYLKKTFLISIH